ncbi:hypothetical protein GXW74_11680 [Roseomonas eburnea]|uniref:Uncharacterized protein n=1 Tax=Neoroseomonas eburnea TaxID=1346889 RepID=A0A9X9XBR0_9PROT|nr:hypothetical protein [Neoroseomonas eburnea]MBR0681146.1 hypothetical protein [Neoroseomonas eburnea]
MNRGRRGRFQLAWFRTDPGAARTTGRPFRLALQVVLAVAALAIGGLAVLPLAWEGRPDPCAALEVLVWRRTVGAVQVPDAVRPAILPGVMLRIEPDGPLPRPIRCTIAYWQRV